MLAVPEMGRRIIWVQFDGPLEFTLRASPVPVISSFDICQRRVSLGERVIDLQRFLSQLPGFGKTVTGRGPIVVVDQSVGISEPGIRQRIVRVLFESVVEVTDGLLYICFGPLVPKITALQV